MKKNIIENINTVLSELNYPSDKLNVQKTKNPIHGDYSCNIAMILCEELGEPPQNIAEKIIVKGLLRYPKAFCVKQ